MGDGMCTLVSLFMQVRFYSLDISNLWPIHNCCCVMRFTIIVLHIYKWVCIFPCNSIECVIQNEICGKRISLHALNIHNSINYAHINVDSKTSMEIIFIISIHFDQLIDYSSQLKYDNQFVTMFIVWINSN